MNRAEVRWGFEQLSVVNDIIGLKEWTGYCQTSLDDLESQQYREVTHCTSLCIQHIAISFLASAKCVAYRFWP